MKLTHKQKQEIDFLVQMCRVSAYGHADYFPSDSDIDEFILFTSRGIGKRNEKRLESNLLMIAKRALDITVKNWIEDLQDGLLLYKEILEDYDNDPYITRIINSVRKRIETRPSYNGVLSLACVGFFNTYSSSEFFSVLESIFITSS